ncbi:unnamed protein product [Macrosiphum euphorbiae]|uniref:C2H2-type domain-containing protein n=1 Tax=Macrosiphum euphorbiae TaxID=13131 RepID=A0AAV0WXA2_9HEMI|nr:unnamed protein product [Macrosiphum euphorbiae]CAI6364330.1 unnamed protein product [Macrosiphum euphorbiae]
MYSSKRKRIKFECMECGSIFNNDYRLQHERIVLIECAIKSLSEICNDTNQLDKHISSAKVFAIKMKTDPISDFEKHHRKRIKPRRIDSNSSSQVNFSLESFYRKEFIEVLDTLITLMSSNLKCCLTSVQPTTVV